MDRGIQKTSLNNFTATLAIDGTNEVPVDADGSSMQEVGLFTIRNTTLYQ